MRQARTRERVVTRFFETGRPRVLAHRGFAVGPSPVPQNTLAAFRAALDAGATHLESDVRVSADGVPVLFHDERLPGGRPVGDLSLAELVRVELGGGHRIPTLAEALSTFDAAFFNLDLKAPDAVVPAARAIRRASAADRVLVTSFSEFSRTRAVRLLPGVATSASTLGTALVLLATATGSAPVVRGVVAALPGRVRALQIPERAAGVTLVRPHLVHVLHAAGLEVHVWTVNERDAMERLLAVGVDGLVTDRTDLAIEVSAVRRTGDRDTGS